MKAKPAAKPVWGNLLHLSYNMWLDWDVPRHPVEDIRYRPYLRFDETLWRDLLGRMARAGMSLLVLDLGDAVRYRSHPEIAVRAAWTPRKLRQELARVRDLGIEPIPKLNFSSSHDAWMGEYSRCLSTPKYYRVCADLIAEVIELFDGPRLFHLGMDEETFEVQRAYEYVVVRQADLWWHDVGLLFDHVRRGGSRPWVWSDYCWTHGEDYAKRMPKDVLQSNWYYGRSFDRRKHVEVSAYLELDRLGFDQVPTGSNFLNLPDENFGLTVRWARRNLAPRRLLGFLQTPWRPTLEKYRQDHERAIDLVAAEIARWKA